MFSIDLTGGPLRNLTAFQHNDFFIKFFIFECKECDFLPNPMKNVHVWGAEVIVRPSNKYVPRAHACLPIFTSCHFLVQEIAFERHKKTQIFGLEHHASGMHDDNAMPFCFH